MREAGIEQTEQGRLPVGEGWFILGLGEMPWETVPGFGVWRDFDWAEQSGGEPGVGVHVHVLEPGENFGYYHAEAVQEGFIVISGECLAVVEGGSGRCASGTTCIHRQAPLTSLSELAMDPAYW